MHKIYFGDTPRWYALYWDFDSKELRVGVHKEFVRISPSRNMTPYFEHAKKRFDDMALFDSYQPLLGEKTFGINDSIVLVGQSEDWLTYRVKIPVVVHKTGMACKWCDGSGDRDGGMCYACNGDKVERDYVFDEISRVCSSLSTLFSSLHYPIDEDMPNREKQLFVLESGYASGQHGHSTYGTMSPIFRIFLENLAESDRSHDACERVAHVMSYVSLIMEGKESSGRMGAGFPYGGRLWLCCPGDACELHSEETRSDERDLGVGLTCHNLDTGIQQLTLIAGLAAFASLFDEANRT